MCLCVYEFMHLCVYGVYVLNNLLEYAHIQPTQIVEAIGIMTDFFLVVLGVAQKYNIKL